MELYLVLGVRLKQADEQQKPLAAVDHAKCKQIGFSNLRVNPRDHCNAIEPSRQMFTSAGKKSGNRSLQKKNVDESSLYMASLFLNSLKVALIKL